VNIGGVILAGFFCFTRIAFTVCYMVGLQPFRLIFFLLGLITVLIMLIWNIIYTTLHDDSPSYLLKITMIVCWTFLIVKLYLIGLLTAISRVRTGILASPEDRAMINTYFPTPNENTLGEFEFRSSRVERLLNCHHDDLQVLIPLALTTVLFFSWGLANLEGIDFWGLSMTFIALTILRTFHSFFFIQEPPRSYDSKGWKVVFVVGHISLAVLLYWVFFRMSYGAFSSNE